MLKWVISFFRKNQKMNGETKVSMRTEEREYANSDSDSEEREYATSDSDSRELRKKTWKMIVYKNKCPVCKCKGRLYEGPRGGAAMNMICDACKSRFWMAAPEFGMDVGESFGAYKI